MFSCDGTVTVSGGAIGHSAEDSAEEAMVIFSVPPGGIATMGSEVEG